MAKNDTRFNFVGTIDGGAAGSEAARRMKDIVRDVDPDFRVNILGADRSGQTMLGSTNREAYERLFGPIVYDGFRWRLSGRPAIHPELEGIVTSAGPERIVTMA